VVWVQKRGRELLIYIYDSEGVRILKGVVSKDHTEMHVEYSPKLSLSNLVKRLKEQGSRRLQDEFPSLKERYWRRHLWAIGFGAWSTANTTEEIVQGNV